MHQSIGSLKMGATNVTAEDAMKWLFVVSLLQLLQIRITISRITGQTMTSDLQKIRIWTENPSATHLWTILAVLICELGEVLDTKVSCCTASSHWPHHQPQKTHTNPGQKFSLRKWHHPGKKRPLFFCNQGHSWKAINAPYIFRHLYSASYSLD